MDCAFRSQQAAFRAEQQARRARARDLDLERLTGTANGAKDQLIALVRQLENAGLKRKAEALNTIIGRLECWQNSK